MASNLGVEFTIGANTTKGIAALQAFQDKVRDTGNVLTTELGDKLKTAFSAAAIEETVRRTGEWAQGLEKAAIALGTTNDKLQTMNLLANKANIDEGVVTGFFNTLEDKRDAAIKGNMDLILSFQAMGVSFQELQHMSRGEIFSKMLGNGSLQGIQRGTFMGNAMENVIGSGNISQFQALQKAGGGKTLDELAKENEDAGNTAKKGDVTEMSQQWTQVKQDLSRALIALVPIGKILLSIATVFSSAILGISTFINKLIHLDFQGMGLVLANACFGIVKMVTGLFDILHKIPLIGKYLGPKGGVTAKFQDQQDLMNNTYHRKDRENIERGGEGIGEGIGMVAGGGVGGAVGKIAENSLMKIALSSRTGYRIGSMAYRTSKGLGLLGRGAGVMGAAAAGLLGSSTSTNGNTITAGSSTVGYNGTALYQGATNFTGESQGNLRIGGTFGTGIQARMVKLAQTQIDLLSQIVKNTSYLNQFSGQVTKPNPLSRPAGGS